MAYLEAIESGQFQFLPEQIYAEGFIRAYGRELGIDSSLILFHYRDYLRNFAGAEREQEKKKTLPPAPKRPADAARRADIGRPFFRWVKGHRQMLGRSLVVILAAFAVFYFCTPTRGLNPVSCRRHPRRLQKRRCRRTGSARGTREGTRKGGYRHCSRSRSVRCPRRDRSEARDATGAPEPGRHGEREDVGKGHGGRGTAFRYPA